jgi:hypothetical protein
MARWRKKNWIPTDQKMDTGYLKIGGSIGPKII